MTRLLSHPDRADRPARIGPPQPVAAVLTDRMDDVAVAETAARLALARDVPLLLIAVIPAHIRRSPLGPGSTSARAVLSRVLPAVGRHGVGYIPEVFHLPPAARSRLAAAKDLLALACRRRVPDLVAARRGPAGLDAFTLVEAAALRGGPYVHTVAPAAWAPPLPSSP